MNLSLRATRPSARVAAGVVLAGLLAASAAEAGTVTYSTTAFTGSLFTDLTSVGDQSLPYTAGNGTSVSIATGGDQMIVGSMGGLLLLGSVGSSETYDLGAAVDKIGFSTDLNNSAGTPYIASAVFSNGDVFTGDASYTVASFAALATSAPFTSVTVTWGLVDTSNGHSFILSDFRASPVSVPEPSSLALLAAGLAIAWRRRQSA